MSAWSLVFWSCDQLNRMSQTYVYMICILQLYLYRSKQSYNIVPPSIRVYVVPVVRSFIKRVYYVHSVISISTHRCMHVRPTLHAWRREP